MTCTQAGSLGHLGQTTILPLRVHHCNLEEGQGGAGWEDPGYIWEEFGEGTFCVYANKTFVGDLHFCVSLWFSTRVACRLCQWPDPPLPAGGKGQAAGRGW